MPTRAFRMTLYPGCAEEYRRRHDAIWPELVAALRDAGVEDYRIFLDEESLALFAVMTHRDEHALERLPELPVMQRWWSMMADLMVTRNDSAPVEVELVPMFSLADHPTGTGGTHGTD
ncbi:L-rhamnose mutarotase [Kushneria sinocarnis]|uniref:L-rhamnose mutarotase n=1 Tax=Kushneria sinocarnis TaxID=595502 RepID=A0A420WW66_9GAMM|nr:L-rhamnose mutarotase [Kushneria sinocarnis]RKR03354.1 L-rhamnose mutarotase [Kushneria sinocarnis]